MSDTCHSHGNRNQQRWLPIEGCVNFRDLGGYRNSQGRPSGGEGCSEATHCRT